MSAKIFVSYSRKDSVAARKLVDAFKKMDYDVWVDLEDIHPATNWMDEIEMGIEKSDAFVFLISPESIKSEVCNIEIAHAAKYNKRIVPVILSDVPSKETSKTIRYINWISLRELDDFDEGIKNIKNAIELDFAWLTEHNKLLEKTLDWHHGKTTDLLLRGGELRRVQKAVNDAKGKEPKLLELQEKFLAASVKNERRRRILWSVVSAVIGVLAGLTIFAVIQRNLARENEKLATENAILANQQRAIAVENEELARKNERDAKQAQLEAEKQRLIAVDRARFALAQQNAARAQIYQWEHAIMSSSSMPRLSGRWRASRTPAM